MNQTKKYINIIIFFSIPSYVLHSFRFTQCFQTECKLPKTDFVFDVNVIIESFCQFLKLDMLHDISRVKWVFRYIISKLYESTLRRKSWSGFAILIYPFLRGNCNSMKMRWRYCINYFTHLIGSCGERSEKNNNILVCLRWYFFKI
jgi:hypothetical protein